MLCFLFEQLLANQLLLAVFSEAVLSRAVHPARYSCHDSQGKIWDEIQDNESDLVDRKELKIYLSHRLLVDLEHLGVYLARPIPYRQDFHRGKDEKP